MAENEAPNGATDEATEPVETETEATETDWKALSRKWESRAKESFARAKANEDAAKRLAEIEEAQKTEEQKSAEKVAALEARAAELELGLLRAQVANTKGVPAELLSGSDEESLTASADALLKYKTDTANAGYIAPNEGRGSGAPGVSTADSFSRFVEKQLN